jgi:opacity protein-like surface antigen
MTNFKLLGAVLFVAAMAAPASAQVFEPAAVASQNPNFSIYSGGGGYAFRSSPPIAAQPFNSNAMVGTRHRARHAPTRY